MRREGKLHLKRRIEEKILRCLIQRDFALKKLIGNVTGRYMVLDLISACEGDKLDKVNGYEIKVDLKLVRLHLKWILRILKVIVKY